MERDLVVVADDRRAAAQLLAQKGPQQLLVLQLHELMALEARKPEEIFIQRKKPRVAHRADHAVIPLWPLRIVGFEDPGDFFMPAADQMPGQQIPAAVIVVADAEGVGDLPAAPVQKRHRQPALPERLIELRVRVRQRRLASLDQDPRRGIEQQLLQNIPLAADGVFRGVDDDGEALRGKAGLHVLEKRGEDVVAQRGRDHGDPPVLPRGGRAEKAAAAAPLFDEPLLLQYGQRLPERLAADGKLRGKRLLARQLPLPVCIPLRQRRPQPLHQLLIFWRHRDPPPMLPPLYHRHGAGSGTDLFVFFGTSGGRAKEILPFRGQAENIPKIFRKFSNRPRKIFNRCPRNTVVLSGAHKPPFPVPDTRERKKSNKTGPKTGEKQNVSRKISRSAGKAVRFRPGSFQSCLRAAPNLCRDLFVRLISACLHA